MEQYLDAKIKRFTQKQLFKKITKVKTMLGLGGLHPEKYLEVVPEHKNCVLVDFNPADALVRRNSLIGEFDLLTNSPAERSPLNFVDCDFCKSIINNGADIYTKMQLLQLEINISHLLLVVRTIEWLAKNFPELDIPRNYVFINDIVSMLYDPTRDRFLDIYRDSGDNMITGLIKIL